MLTAEQKIEAEKKLKNITQEKASDEDIKARISTLSNRQKKHSRQSTMLSLGSRATPRNSWNSSKHFPRKMYLSAKLVAQ
jgi:hypothetical protein